MLPCFFYLLNPLGVRSVTFLPQTMPGMRDTAGWRQPAAAKPLLYSPVLAVKT